MKTLYGGVNMPYCVSALTSVVSLDSVEVELIFQGINMKRAFVIFIILPHLFLCKDLHKDSVSFFNNDHVRHNSVCVNDVGNLSPRAFRK